MAVTSKTRYLNAQMRRKVARAAFALITASLISMGLIVLIYSMRADRIDLSVVRTMPKASLIFDSHGQILGRFFDENRIVMPPGSLPKNLVNALISTEDQRFYSHKGIDPLGILRAALSNVTGIGIRQGASTITQQLARNSIGRFDRTYDRKLLEIFLALRIERSFSKEEILRFYLDRIYYGQGIYGAETAANAFFNKSVNDLDLSESALLAGMISGPNSFSPWKNFKAALAARSRALSRMEKEHVITSAQRKQAEAQPLSLRPRTNFAGSYYQDEIRKLLEEHLTAEQISQGGLMIYSTIDFGLQDTAERMVNLSLTEVEQSSDYPRRKQGGVLQAAFYSLDPATGAIRAMVGGRDYQSSPFNRATMAKRQVGSTLKPLVYAVTFAEKNFSPVSWIENTPFDLTKTDGATAAPTVPRTFLRVNDAIVKSDNFAAVRAGELIGPELFVYYAQQAGVQSGIPPFPSSYIGACQLTLAELTGLYATFANGGVWNKPYLITEVRSETGKVLYKHEAESRRVFSPEIAFQITGILQNVINYGTGQSLRSRFNFTEPAAGKTGTTNDYRDAWFVGYTSSLVAGAWVGLDQPATTMPGGYGGRLALPIWARVFLTARGHYPMDAFAKPATLEEVTLSNGLFSGKPDQTVYLLPEQVSQVSTKPESGSEASPVSSEKKRSLWDRLFGGD
jgi:penicillin-binding protein 1A